MTRPFANGIIVDSGTVTTRSHSFDFRVAAESRVGPFSNVATVGYQVMRERHERNYFLGSSLGSSSGELLTTAEIDGVFIEERVAFQDQVEIGAGVRSDSLGTHWNVQGSWYVIRKGARRALVDRLVLHAGIGKAIVAMEPLTLLSYLDGFVFSSIEAGSSIRDQDGLIGPTEYVRGDSLEFGGSALPNRALSLHNEVNLGGRLSVGGTLEYRGGRHAVNDFEAIRCLVGECRWLSDPETPRQRQAEALAMDEGAMPLGFIEDASFVKLRELSVRYTVSQGWARLLGGEMRLSLTGHNLATWTGFSGPDPEVSPAVTGRRGLGRLVSAPPSRLSFGVELVF